MNRWTSEAIPVHGTRAWSLPATLGLHGSVLLLFVAGTAAVGVAHQTAWLITSPESIPLVHGSIRELTTDVQSANNLKEIALASDNYRELKGNFPPGGIFDTYGRGMHGWQTILLPYLE